MKSSDGAARAESSLLGYAECSRYSTKLIVTEEDKVNRWSRGEERPMYGQIETTDIPHRGYAPKLISSLSGSS